MDATAATAAAAQNGGPGSPTLKAAPSTTAALDTSVSSAPMGEDVATLREQLAAERARRAKMNAGEATESRLNSSASQQRTCLRYIDIVLIDETCPRLFNA
jgi:hypothetical protein